MPEVLEGTLDARVAPARVLLRHPSNQLADFHDHAAPRRSVLGVGPCAGDELPVPSQQRVRRDDCRDLAQSRTAQPVGARGKFPPVVIGEPEAPPAQLPPQDSILLDQVSQHLALPLVQPAGNRQQQHLEG